MAQQGGLNHHELTKRLGKEFPQTFEGPEAFMIEAAGPLHARVRLPYHEKHLRPGGTMSGPSMFALADCTVYIAILASIGWKPLAVTTNLTINFMNKPAPKALIADCRLLKLGKTLAVGEVYMRSEGQDSLVAHAMATYAIPPDK